MIINLNDQRPGAPFTLPISDYRPVVIRLDRDIDRENPCCSNTVVVLPGKGPHAAELRCAVCDKFRGWLPKEGLRFVCEAAARFGAPEAITFRTVKPKEDPVQSEPKPSVDEAFNDEIPF